MKFKKYIAENFPDDWNTEWIESEVLSEGVDYALTSGGKRVRPLLCLKLCGAFNGDMKQSKTFARSIETFHNYTLVHDDIQDGDSHRRDKEAVWNKYGRMQGITIGDSLHSISYHYLLKNSDSFDDSKLIRLLKVLNDADRRIGDGQAMDISFRDRRDISEEEYLEMVQKKTGELLTAALKGASIIAEVDGDARDSVEEFGNKIGPAFQIRDDVIDLVGNKGRESNGQDIGEGKRSLVVVKALNKLDDGEIDELFWILDKPKEETTQEDTERAIELFRSVNAIEEANQVAEQLIEEGLNELDKINDDYDVSDIREITEFLVERKF